MPTSLDLKRRIRSVRNTQQITRAMKFVAAARLRRAQERAFAARPYARALTAVVRSAISRTETDHPLLQKRPENRVLLLVVSGERGLCGAFNANVLRRSFEFLRGHDAQPGSNGAGVITLGRKGRDALRKQHWNVIAEFVDIGTRVQSEKAAEIAQLVISRYQAEETDAVYIVFNEFKSVLSQILTLEKILPIETPTAAQNPGEAPVDYLYEEPAAGLLGKLLPRYVEAQIYRALAESTAAEHAARMTAMDSATNNARELIDKLTLYMNKVRQAAITKEIIEIVSGAASAS